MGTLINKNQLDSGVYTIDNLVAGNGIEIVSAAYKYIVSDMSRNDYVSLNDTISLGSYPFSFTTHFLTGSYFTYGALLSVKTSSFPTIGVGVENDGRVVFLQQASQNSLQFSIYTSALQTNTEYWLKAEYDGANANLYIGQTKASISGSPTYTQAVTSLAVASNTYALGSWRLWSQQDTFNGSIWISDTQIVSNGVTLFDGSDSTQYSIVGTPTITKVSDSSSNIKSINNTGANDSLSNLSNAGKIQVAHLGAPSTTYDNLTLGSSDDQYTAPADGYVVVSATSTGSQYVNVGTVTPDVWYKDQRTSPTSGWSLTPILPVRKGEKFYVSYNVPSNSFNYFMFIYAVGAESEQGV